jgi:polysaccharide deacetylase family protein (PEP-CTERM system associated)
MPQTTGTGAAESGCADPARRRYEAALSVDVEDYFHAEALSGVIERRQWDELPRRFERNTQRMLDLLDEHGVSATFFVLGWVAQRAPGLVKEIERRGHEVGCHGMSHQLVYKQQPAEFRAETLAAKRLLEDLTGAPVSGYRAASYSIVSRSLWALDVLLEIGFRYDSSIFPVRHDLYGMPGARRGPHRLATEGGGEITEFPPTTFRLLGQNVPVAGGGYFRLYPYALTRFLLRRVVSREKRPLMFYIHPWEIDPEQPRVAVRGLSRFRHYNNLEICERRLRALLGDFAFGSVAAVLAELGLLPAAQ